MEKYFLGLDIGTGSVGWAVTDPQYHIVRKHGKALWGSRLFETANTAEERRTFRSARRRQQRKVQRIKWLQEIFSEEINKVDPGFYLRMKESRYYPEDKLDADGNTPILPYALFVDEKFTDKDYHKKYPTIYHLRKHLMESKEKDDVRLIYLVLHHMMKHRGHFLFEGKSIDDIKEFKPVFQQFCVNVEQELGINLSVGEDAIQEIELVLKDKNNNRTQKKKALISILSANTKSEKALYTLLAGGKAKLSDVFSDEELNECEHSSISFSDATYEDYESELEDQLQERFSIIANAKAIYDWSLLADILGDDTLISYAKVKTYEKHKADLKLLKTIVKKEIPMGYKHVFCDMEDKLCNYPAYIGMGKINGEKIALAGKRASKDDFYQFVKKDILTKLPDSEQVQYIQNEIEKGTFLPLQVNKDNGVIPYQLNLIEMKKIIDRAEKYYPFLKEKKEKIISIFTFRIPYYVGPLNTYRQGEKGINNWIVRKEGKIYPWNFNEIVDCEASAERFIRNLTNKCTYLPQEDVLPKDSLLYSEFMVLNQINNLRIDGMPIDVTLKQSIYHEVFERYRNVTVKRIKTFLKNEGIIGEFSDITGIDEDYKGSLKSYHDFKEKLTDLQLSNEDKDTIILNICLFGEDKKLLRKRLKKLFPQMTDGQLKAVSNLNYSGWGRLSREFLTEVTAPNPETGEVINVIRALRETNDNLMQILSEKYLFIDALREKNASENRMKLNYESIEGLYVSPSVRRQIWQSVLLIKEIKKIMGGDPSAVFIEMAREKQDSRRTVSRKNQLLDLYKKCKSEQTQLMEELQATDDQVLRRDKLYLYYTQKGRCMYSGDIIKLSELFDNNLYDIDHIYPQSKTMDDSLNNRVLVKKEDNARKSDTYPLPKETRDARHAFWQELLREGFISKEKYLRLTRGTLFSEEELAGFINRQLVETRQSTKAVADILKQAMPESKVVYVKAGIVSDFRRDFELIKVREMNDLHHAKDAYLNIVVGNVYDTKFTQNAAWYVKNNPGRTYNLRKMFISKDVERNGYTAWIAGDQGTISQVKDTMGKNNILVTRQAYEVKGGFFDQQLMKKGKGQIPVKSSDSRLCNIEKYGGYNKATGAYFFLVESDGKKGSRQRTIEVVPLYKRSQIQRKGLLQYCIEDLQLKNPRIIIKEIKINTLFDIDGFKMSILSRTGNQIVFQGENQLLLDLNSEKILKKVDNCVKKIRLNKGYKISEYDCVNKNDLIDLYNCFIHKLGSSVYRKRLSSQKDSLVQYQKLFAELSIEDQCVQLINILPMFQCSKTNANLSALGGAKTAGRICLSNNITKIKHFYVIYNSITGVYEKRINLQEL